MEDIKKIKSVNVFYPIFIIAYIGASILFAVITQANGIVLPLWSQYVLSQMFILIPAVLYAVLFKENFPKEISYRPLKPLDALLSLCTGYALVPLVLFIGNLTMLFATNYLDESANMLTQYPFAGQIVLMAVIPSIVEEFVFRGIFFHTYRRIGIFAGAVVSGLVFAVFHMNINQFCYALVVGFIFAYIAEATGSMWSSVLAHFALNTYSLGVMALVEYLSAHSAAFKEQYELAQSTVYDLPVSAIVSQFVMLGGAAVCFLFFAVLMIRKMAKRNGHMENIRIFNRQEKAGFKQMITWPLIVTTVCCAAYMISMEL